MKKKILLFALVAIMAFAAMSVSASGTSTISLKNYYPTDDSYTITYNVGEANAAALYGMIVVAGTGENVDLNTILYIDQATANDAGIIKFENFAPMGEAPSEYDAETDAAGDNDGILFEECTVYIGGASIGDTAQAIGILKNGSGVPVSGTVVDTVSSKFATIKILDGTDEIGTAETDENGEFSLTIGGGENLTVTVSKTSYLTFTYTGVDVTGAVDLGEIDVSDCAGDVDGNGIVEFPDLQEVLAVYNEGSEDAADVDGNGIVEFPDLQAILASYNDSASDRIEAFTPAQ